HIIGTMVGSRSKWIAADFIIAVLAGLAIWSIVKPLLQGHATDTAIVLGVTIAVAFAVIVATSGAWQLSRGRTDRVRNHLELSRYLWSGIAIVLLLAGTY